MDGWDLPTVSLGDSDKVQIGDRVVAIGNPIGLETTVSDGIVSAKRDKLQDKLLGFEMLQITTPISPGSSGGALFNLSGEVIGITTASFPAGQNLNLAVPINYVKTILRTAMPNLLKDSARVAKERAEESPEKETSKARGIEGIQQIEKLRQDYDDELSKLNIEITLLSKDSVRLKPGFEVVGSIIKKTDDSVIIELKGGGRATFQMEQVISVKQISPQEAEALEALRAKRQRVIEKYENQFRSAGLRKYRGDWVTEQEYRALLAERKREKELKEFKKKSEEVRKKREKELAEVRRRERALKYVVAGDEYWNTAIFYHNQISDLGPAGALETIREVLIWYRKSLSAYEKASKLYPKLREITEADLRTRIGKVKREIKRLKRFKREIWEY